MNRADFSSNDSAEGPPRGTHHHDGFNFADFWSHPPPLVMQPRNPFPPSYIAQDGTSSPYPRPLHPGPLHAPNLPALPRLGDHIPSLMSHVMTTGQSYTSTQQISARDHYPFREFAREPLPPPSSFATHPLPQDIRMSRPDAPASMPQVTDADLNESEDEAMDTHPELVGTTSWPLSLTQDVEVYRMTSLLNHESAVAPSAVDTASRRPQRARRPRTHSVAVAAAAAAAAAAASAPRTFAPALLPPPRPSIPHARQSISQLMPRSRQSGVVRSRPGHVGRRAGRSSTAAVQAELERDRAGGSTPSLDAHMLEAVQSPVMHPSFTQRFEDGAAHSRRSTPPDPSESTRRPRLGQHHFDFLLRTLHSGHGTGRVATMAALKSLEKINVKELPEADRSCSICYNDFGVPSPEGNYEEPVRLPDCKHVFGDYCITKWLKESDSCPYCRAKLASEPQRHQVVRQFMSMVRLGNLPQRLTHGTSVFDELQDVSDEDAMEDVIAELQDIVEESSTGMRHSRTHSYTHDTHATTESPASPTHGLHTWPSDVLDHQYSHGHAGSRVQHLASRAQRPDSRVQRPDSRVQHPHPDSRVQRPDSRVPHSDSRVPHPNSRVHANLTLQPMRLQASHEYWREPASLSSSNLAIQRRFHAGPAGMGLPLSDSEVALMSAEDNQEYEAARNAHLNTLLTDPNFDEDLFEERQTDMRGSWLQQR